MNVRLAVLCLLLTAVNGCSSRDKEAEVSYTGGVKVVRNPLSRTPGRELWIDHDAVFSIDLEDPELVGRGLNDAIGFDVAADGRIFILTARGRDAFIHAFDARGKHLISFGRRGQGPGELQDPKYIDVDRSVVRVLDFGRNRILSYGPDGAYLEDSPIPANVRRASRLNDKRTLLLKGLPDLDAAQIHFPVILGDELYQDLQTLDPGRAMPLVAAARRVNGLDLRLDYEAWQIRRGRIYLGNPRDKYEIRVYDFDGRLAQVINRDYTPIPIPEGEKATILAWLEANAPKHVKKVFFPAHLPAFQYFFLDEDGRIFVMTYERAESGRAFVYDVFDADGILAGRTRLDNFGTLPSSPLGLAVPLKVVARGGRLYYLREKDSGGKELAVSRIAPIPRRADTSPAR